MTLDAAPTPPTILIADDEPRFVSALARAVRSEGFSYITDTSAQNVHELARTHRPALIILDVNQNIDGRDLLARLKRDPETRGLSVIMVSGSDDPFTRSLCLELGAVDFFPKPLDPVTISRISRLVRRQADANATGEPPGGTH